MSVFIGYPHGRRVEHVFHQALLNTALELGGQGGLVRAIKPVSAGAYSLDRARNMLCEAFLATDAEWLLFVDTDMEFTPADVRAIVAASHPVARPVMGALCFKIAAVNDDVGPVLLPTLSRSAGEGEPMLPVTEYRGIERVDATGAAFLLIHCGVLTKIGERWFSHHPEQDCSSEDTAFCLRLRDHGIPLHVDTRIKIGHEKAVVLTEREYLDLLRRVAGLDEPLSETLSETAVTRHAG